METNFIEIDGSYLEGGGQILRTATALSCLIGKPCHIKNIRKGREKPGLKSQHLYGLLALAKLYQAELKGAKLHSEEIWFKPKKILPQTLKVRIPTAGAITLVLQNLILPASLSSGPIVVKFFGGATDTYFAPTLIHTKEVLLPFLQKIGFNFEIKVKQYGYYPKGGAEVVVKIFPFQKKSLPSRLEFINRGKLKKILIKSSASQFLKERKVAERQADQAEKILKEKFKAPLIKNIQYFKTSSPGSSLDLLAYFENSILGANGLGKIGKRAEEIGSQAVSDLIFEINSNAFFDHYLADQVIPYLSWMPAKEIVFSVSKITCHLRTNCFIVSKFLNRKFKIEKNLVRIG